jgi:hypothetical protein
VTAQQCACGCGRPVTDGYATPQCAQELATALRTASGHAEDVEAVLARQTRYGTGSRGGSDEPLPADLTAMSRLAPIANTIVGWVRVVTEQTGRAPRWRPMAGPTCAVGVQCDHLTCAAIRRRLAGPPLGLMAAWLAQHVDTLRQHPAAAEAFTDLHAACGALERLVDRPADKDLVGVCDCGKVLYAPAGRVFVTCPVPTCKQTWHVERSREILREHLGDKLVTLPEAARLLAYLDSDRTQDNLRKLLAARAGKLTPHGQLPAADDQEDELLTYRFGDLVAVLDGIPKRRRAARAAESEHAA